MAHNSTLGRRVLNKNSKLLRFCFSLCLLSFDILFAGILDTIRSYNGFNYEYSFHSSFLLKKGKGIGYTNLLLLREERKGEIHSPAGVKKYHCQGAGDWEYVKSRKGWEKRTRSEDSDIMRILEILLVNNPAYGETIFKPNLVFLGLTDNEKAKGEIRYQKGKIREIIARDSWAKVEFRIKLNNKNRLKEISIPFSPASRIIFPLPQEKELLAILHRRLVCLKLNYQLKRQRKKAILTLAEKLEDNTLSLLFASGKFNIYQDDSLFAPGDLIKLSLLPLGIIFEIPSTARPIQPENFTLRIDEKISLPLTLDQWEKDGRIKTLKLERQGKERDFLFCVLQETLPYPIPYEVKK